MKLLRRMAYLSVLTVVVPNVVNAQEPLLNLQEAVSIAVQEDPWLTAKYRSRLPVSRLTVLVQDRKE